MASHCAHLLDLTQAAAMGPRRNPPCRERPAVMPSAEALLDVRFFFSPLSCERLPFGRDMPSLRRVQRAALVPSAAIWPNARRIPFLGATRMAPCGLPGRALKGAQDGDRLRR